MEKKQVLIIDLGSQYTLVIARVVTSLGIQCRVVKPGEVADLDGVKGIILSGSNYSVTDPNAPRVPESIFESTLPIFGICYGMQYMAYREDKKSVWSESGKKEYGPITIELVAESPLFKNLNNTFQVYASHGDSVHVNSQDYTILAESKSVGIQAMQHKTKPWYGVQFHPEVDDTKDDNNILKNFLYGICLCQKDWSPEQSISEIVAHVMKEVGDGKAVIGVSGGVDSTTIAAILSPVMKDNLHCVLIDHGGMREGEVDEVKEVCRESGINLHVVDAKDSFIQALESIDAEQKRHEFKEIYREIFSNEIKKVGATHMIQGTLATDLIESGATGESVKIKSHHNVGLDFGVTEVKPFAHLFKHEVRDIAKSMNLSFSGRQPFPGPGLYVRIIGLRVTKEYLETLGRADRLVSDTLKKEGLYDTVSQLIVALLGVYTVGVQGDERTYSHPIIVRAVQTGDFMTSSGVMFPETVRQKIISELTSHGLTNRVFFDETPKPPATTEME